MNHTAITRGNYKKFALFFIYSAILKLLLEVEVKYNAPNA